MLAQDMNINTRYVPIYTLGFLEVDVPTEILDVLWQEVKEIEVSNFTGSNPHNQYLAGNLEKEFELKKSLPVMNDFVAKIAPMYWRNYNSDMAKKKHLIDTIADTNKKSLWVNFQKKGEVNPIHAHTGILSFVLYLKIPYSFEEEHALPSNIKSNNPMAGAFQFVYCDQYVPGGVNTFNIPTDKMYTGKMIIFSAHLKHMVYPFYTSDDYRISIAGNITIEDE